MSRAIDINIFVQDIKQLQASIKYPGKLLLDPVKALEKNIKERVFLNGLYPTGARIGDYRAAWAEVRASQGLQIQYIDLKFTGKLRESIKSSILGNASRSKTSVLYVSSDEAYREKFLEWEKVFEASEQEVDELLNDFEIALDVEIENIL